MKSTTIKLTHLQYTICSHETRYHTIHHPFIKLNNTMNPGLPPPFWGDTVSRPVETVHNTLTLRMFNIYTIDANTQLKLKNALHNLQSNIYI